MNLEYRETEIGGRRRVAAWLKHRLAVAHARDTGAWRFALAALWLAGCAAAGVSALGMPTGLGSPFDVGAGVALHTAGMAIASWLVAALLSLAGAKLPRLAVGGIAYTGALFYFVFYYAELGWKASLAMALGCALAFGGTGLLAGAIARMPRRPRRATLGAAAVALAIGVAAAAGWLRPDFAGSADDADLATAADDGGEVRALAAIDGDPSRPGGYEYRYFTYGSGQDKHRDEFAEGVSFVSPSVDASAYIDRWPWLRRLFWGFDETNLPLNGRVWLPEGDGPFPVVLMVHGNHLMEKFSDAGYGYLGELLASRGIAAVSVDENFLNYSAWSGIPKEDMKARAWTLLKHVQLLQTYAVDESTPFYGRLDFDRVALLGHSRGGQAAAMAADADRWFADDAGLPDAAGYEIRAVIALAPTDTEVDGQRPELRDVSYLTLQGAKDADLVNFYGDRQYGRVTYSGEDEDAFKSSLYISDANHSQFNESWGRSDNAMPAALFIRPKALLGAEEQRKIARVYVSAFAEAVLHGDDRYDALFRDYRTGLAYLPDTAYFNQFESGSFRTLADFAGSERGAPSPGVVAEASDLTDWRHADALDRQGQGKADPGAVLEWEDEASYTIRLEETVAEELGEDEILMFSLANMAGELEEEIEADEAPPELDGGEESAAEAPLPLSIDVEVEDGDGNSARLPLSDFMETEPLETTEFTWLPSLEPILAKGKYKEPAEPVYQTYELPLSEFREANPAFDPAAWVRLTFHFNEGPGKVMLDSVGLMAA